jgi:hypothetical protein
MKHPPSTLLDGSPEPLFGPHRGGTERPQSDQEDREGGRGGYRALDGSRQGAPLTVETARDEEEGGR